MTYGHDEYMYNVLVGKRVPDPQGGPLHDPLPQFLPVAQGAGVQVEGGREGHQDAPLGVLEFNKFDLYSKSDDLPDPEALRPYYQSLIDKYCPGKLRW